MANVQMRQEQVLNVSPSKHGDDKKWWSKGKILDDAIGIDIGRWLEAGVRQLGYASMSFRKKPLWGSKTGTCMQVSINRSKPGNAACRHIMKSGRRERQSSRQEHVMTRHSLIFISAFPSTCQSRSRSLVAPELPPTDATPT